MKIKLFLKRATKLTIFLVSLILFTLTGLLLLANSFPFQNYVVNTLEKFYSDELKCKVEIGRVHFTLTQFELHEIVIDDQQQDSLLRVATLSMYPRFTSLFTRHITMRKIVMEHGRINFMKHPGVKGTNIDFLRKYFMKKPKGPRPKRPPFVLDVTDVELVDCSISWSDKRYKPVTAELDLSYLEFNKLNASISGLQAIDDSINLHIEHLDFTEKCGWKVDSLVSHLAMSDHQMVFTDFRLCTPHSKVGNYLELNYDEYEDLEEFVDSVNLKGTIVQSLVSMKDIQYFNHTLQGMKQDFELSGELNGKINNLKTKNVLLAYGNKTFFKGKARFKGLPDVDETYMDITVDNAITNHADLCSLLMTDEIPKQVANAGMIDFSGHFNGFLYDFVTSGRFHSEIGDMESDINMKLPNNGKPTYEGSFSLIGFDAGRFYQTGDILGNIFMNARVDGSGFKFGEIAANIKAEVNSLRVNEYDYTNATIDGRFSDQAFKGKLTMVDPAIGLSFAGLMDFKRKVPRYKFIAEVDKARLKDLHWDSANTVISTVMDIDLEGTDIDDMRGRLKFQHAYISRDKHWYNLNDILFTADTKAGNGFISLKSDVMDIRVDGQYRLAELPDALQNFFHHYLPKYAGRGNKLMEENLSFSINVKKPDVLTNLFLPKLTLGKTEVKCSFVSANNDINMNIVSSRVVYEGIEAKNIVLSTAKEEGTSAITLKSTVGNLQYNDSVNLENVTINGQLISDSFTFRLISYEPRQSFNADLSGMASFVGDSVHFYINKSFITIQRKKYEVKRGSAFAFANGNFKIYSLRFENNNEALVAKGIISSNHNDILDITLSNFDLRFMNGLARIKRDYWLQGTATGRLGLHGAYRTRTMDAELMVQQMIVGLDSLGQLMITSNFDQDNKSILLDLQIADGYLKGVTAKGYIYLKPTTKLDFDVTVPKTPLKRFEHYGMGLASKFQGGISGKLKVKGSADEPLVTGTVLLEDAHFRVDYLNTYYRLNQAFILYDNYIDLGRLQLFDEKNNTAFVQGKVYHKSYDHYRLDVLVNNAKDFFCLNTKKGDNSLYYGEAYATGYAKFTGPVEDIVMDIKGKSEKGTRIFIPLTGEVEAGSANFIKYVDKSPKAIKAKKDAKKAEDDWGYSMNFNFEVNNNAEIQLIFDEALGDIMKGTGNANLKLVVDSKGEYKMYGAYTVEQGEYLFTTMNVFQKKFFVKRGGTITWDGDPYKGIMNLTAYYRVRTNPDDLLGKTTGGTQKINVDCNLFLNGELFAPEIRFGLSFPDIESQNKDNNLELVNKIKQIESDQEEMNRQIFSLMLLKRFLPPSGLSNGGGSITGGVNASVTDLLSAQMSNWLSQVAPGWEVNFNYQAGNVANNRAVVLGLLKRFLDDRLIIEGSYSFDNNQQNSQGIGQYNFSGQYILSKDGRLRIKAFSRSNTNTADNQNVITHGVGLFFHKEFEYLFRRKKK